MQKPVHIHTPTTMSAMLLICGAVSHETGRAPSEVRSALSTPICTSVPVL